MACFSRCGRKTFFSVEKQTLVDPAVLERIRGPPGHQPTHGSYAGWQSAVRSHRQARRQGLTLSTSWSLWVYHGHLHDTESEQPTVWVSVPAGVSTQLHVWAGTPPPCGATRAPCAVASHQAGRRGLALNPDGHLWAPAGSCGLRGSAAHAHREGGRSPGWEVLPRRQQTCSWPCCLPFETPQGASNCKQQLTPARRPESTPTHSAVRCRDAAATPSLTRARTSPGPQSRSSGGVTAQTSARREKAKHTKGCADRPLS